LFNQDSIILIGGGGHCKVIIDIIRQKNEYTIVGISDLKSFYGKIINDIKIIYNDDELESLFSQGVEFAFVSLGSISCSEKRSSLFDLIKTIGFKIPVISSVNSVISPSAKIGSGSIIMNGVIINRDTVVGENCIINTGAIIEHECMIGDNCHVAPGVVISGGVHVGENSHIGTGASVIQGINIAKHVLIGAGSVVVKNIHDGAKVYGVPAKEQK